MHKQAFPYKIVQSEIGEYMALARRMLKIFNPDEFTLLCYPEYLKERQNLLGEIYDQGLVRLGKLENTKEYLVIDDTTLEPVLEAGLAPNKLIILNYNLASAIRLEYWLSRGGSSPLIIDFITKILN